MKRNHIDVANLPACTKVYQPKAEHWPDDLASFEVFLSLPNAMERCPDVPVDGWLALELGDVKGPNVLDDDLLATRLVATVTLQRFSRQSAVFEEVGQKEIDVTRDILLLDIEGIRSLLDDFDRERAPYLERLVGAEAEALSRSHGGPTEVHLGLRGFFKELGLVAEGATGDSWLTEDALAQARKLMGVPYRRIAAYFQPRAWQNDCAINVDGGREVDVTGAVLRLDLARIHALENYRESAKTLVDPTQLGHSGPYAVRVTERICEHFGVARLAEIDQRMLEEAREELSIVVAVPRRAERVIHVDTFDIVIALHPDGGGRITSTAHDENEPESMKFAIDAVLDLVVAHAENGVDVTTPAYQQGVKNAVETIWAQWATDGRHISKAIGAVDQKRLNG